MTIFDNIMRPAYGERFRVRLDNGDRRCFKVGRCVQFDRAAGHVLLRFGDAHYQWFCLGEIRRAA